MNNASSTLEARIDELEARVAFQESALAELSDALAQARAEGTRNRIMLERVIGELRDVRSQGQADPALEPPPPHY